MSGSWARTLLPDAVASTSYDAANRLTQWGGATLTYDENGSLASDGSRTYGWDARNRLSALGGVVPASFEYDAFGRRVSKTVAGVTTEFVYDLINSVQELVNDSPAANVLLGPGIDEVLQRTDSQAARGLVADGLGSTLALLDSAGAVQTQYSYAPFGMTSTTGEFSGNPIQYTGRENDSTDLYYYRTRYQQPRYSRFIAEDTIGFAGGFNLSAYLSGDPINARDPLGQGPHEKMETQLPNGKIVNKATPLQEIDAAIAEGIEKGWSKKMMDTLKGIRKVVRRGGWGGGAACIILGIFLDPVPVNGDKCPAGPNSCIVVPPTPFKPATPHRPGAEGGGPENQLPQLPGRKNR
jgi:RHS repeat-associated protein